MITILLNEYNERSFFMKPGYKKAELGEIPEEWNITELGNKEFFKIETGSTPSSEQKEYWENGNIEWATPKDLTGKYLNNTERLITKKGLENSNVSLVPEGSIVISTRAPIGLVSLAKTEMTFNQGCKAIVIKNTQFISPEYLYYTILTKVPAMKKAGAGSTFMEISKENFEKIQLLIPHISEQNKIAEVLSTVDDAIALAEEKIQKTERMKKGMMQKLLTRGIGHKKFKKTELGEIPEEWEIVELGNENYFDLFVGGTPSKAHDDYWINGTINWVRSADLIQKYIDKTDKRITKKGLDNSAAKLLPKGAVIISSRVSLGNCSIAGKEVTTSQDCTGIVLKNNQVNSEYLYYTMQLQSKKFIAMGEGSTIRGITQDNLQKIVILIPNKAEQNKINDILSSFDEQIELEIKRKGKFELLKKGLMNELLTGRKRVK